MRGGGASIEKVGGEAANNLFHYFISNKNPCFFKA